MYKTWTMYSLKAITTLTGLTAETLRAWERRYECITPARSTSGRRSYSQQDLEKLKLLVNLTRNGHPIGKIANLDCQQLQQFQQQSAVTLESPHSPFFNQIIDALKDYQIDRCEQLLKRGLLASEPLDYARDILLPALEKVGQLWHDEEINIAQEHMFSSCVKRILLAMINNLHQPSRNNLSMLFATPSGEPHEFGILVSCLIAAGQHFNCYYLGADLPAKDIVEAVQHLKPEVLVIGLVKTPLDLQTKTELEGVINAEPTWKPKLWLGGKGAAHWAKNQQSQPNNVEIINSIDHFHSNAAQLRAISR